MSILTTVRRLAASAVAASLWLAAAPAAGADEPAATALARVELAGRIADLRLPVHAWLIDGAGAEYLLVIAPEDRIRAAGWPCRILDRGAAPGGYVVASSRRADGAAAASSRVRIVHDDGRQWIVAAEPGARETLGELGFEIAGLSALPVEFTGPLRAAAATAAFAPDSSVAEIVGGYGPSNMVAWLRRLSGPEPVIAGGHYAGIPARHTAQAGLTRGLRFAEEHFLALGLRAERRSWSGSGYSGVNLIATQPGTGPNASEIVLVVAHLDDMPSGATAPGADDNASGSAGVLACAAAFRPYRFDRTVRYALFTGEEQGLLGSAAYAAGAKASTDAVYAVINMDMIAWDHSGGPVAELHTRTTSNPDYARDLALFSVFTNVVAAYGLSGRLSPVLRPDAIQYSDHSSFWAQGWPAILAIEDYTSDFNAYYHTTSDTVDKINPGYFTALAAACAGTAAHLAGPAGREPFDLVEVASGDWTVGSGVGAALFHAAHEPGATEAGADGRDRALTNAPANPNPRWHVVHSEPYAGRLSRDARAPDSGTLFRGVLSIAGTNTQPLAVTNRLRFAFPAAPDTGRVYSARIRVDAGHTASGQPFDCVTNLLELVSGGGWLDLPALAAATGGTVYGSCEIGSRPLDQSASACVARLEWDAAAGMVVSTFAQGGVTVVDEIQVRTSLVSGVWASWRTHTNRVSLDASSFESGWHPLSLGLDEPAVADAAARFFRLHRAWAGD